MALCREEVTKICDNVLLQISRANNVIMTTFFIKIKITVAQKSNDA